MAVGRDDAALNIRRALLLRHAGAVVTREMLGREVWRDPGCHLTNVIDLDREGTPMNGQHPLTRREALRAAYRATVPYERTLLTNELTLSQDINLQMAAAFT